MGECHYDLSKAVGKIKGYKRLVKYSPGNLFAHLEKGPVSIVVSSSHISFAMYTGGVITSTECA